MNEKKYSILFEGLAADLSLDEIRNRLSKRFKDSHEIERFLTGKPFIVKKQLDGPTAKRYLDALLQTGLNCMLVDTEEIPVTFVSQTGEFFHGTPFEHYHPKYPFLPYVCAKCGNTQMVKREQNQHGQTCSACGESISGKVVDEQSVIMTMRELALSYGNKIGINLEEKIRKQKDYVRSLPEMQSEIENVKQTLSKHFTLPSSSAAGKKMDKGFSPGLFLAAVLSAILFAAVFGMLARPAYSGFFHLEQLYLAAKSPSGGEPWGLLILLILFSMGAFLLITMGPGMACMFVVRKSGHSDSRTSAYGFFSALLGAGLLCGFLWYARSWLFGSLPGAESGIGDVFAGLSGIGWAIFILLAVSVPVLSFFGAWYAAGFFRRPEHSGFSGVFCRECGKAMNTFTLKSVHLNGLLVIEKGLEEGNIPATTGTFGLARGKDGFSKLFFCENCQKGQMTARFKRTIEFLDMENKKTSRRLDFVVAEKQVTKEEAMLLRRFAR